MRPLRAHLAAMAFSQAMVIFFLHPIIHKEPYSFIFLHRLQEVVSSSVEFNILLYFVSFRFPLISYYFCIGEVWKLHRKLMSPSLKDSTVFSHLSIFNYYIREFCNTKLDEEAKTGKASDVMLPLNVVLLSMYLDATLGIEWHQKTAYANFFSE